MSTFIVKYFETFENENVSFFKPKDLLLIRKFVRGIKGSKRKRVNGEIFEKAANLWA